MPASHLLWGASYEAPDSIGDGINLTDGCVGTEARTCWQGSGKITLQLSECRYVRSLEVHFVRLNPRGFTPEVRVEARGVDASPAVVRSASCRVVGNEGWASVSLDRFVERLIVHVEDLAGGSVAVDEVALLVGENLAENRSYTLIPSPLARYPDSGYKLTDGVLASNATVDGKKDGPDGARRRAAELWSASLGLLRQLAMPTLTPAGGSRRFLPTVATHLLRARSCVLPVIHR